jgi:FixJ family two-component response regulator
MTLGRRSPFVAIVDDDDLMRAALRGLLNADRFESPM